MLIAQLVGPQPGRNIVNFSHAAYSDRTGNTNSQRRPLSIPMIQVRANRVSFRQPFLSVTFP